MRICTRLADASSDSFTELADGSFTLEYVERSQ
jgi:hypothetical protein